MLARWADLGSRSLHEAVQDRITTSAASLAFHWFLAIFPAVIAVLGLAGLVGLSGAQLSTTVHDAGVLLPSQMSQVLDQALKNPLGHRGSTVELLFGIIVALWAAIEAMAALQVALDVAYEVHGDRGFVGRRVMALPLLTITALLGGAASVLLVLGDPLQRLFPATDPLWLVLRWAGAIVLATLLLSTYYAIGPKREKLRWSWITPGTVVATAGWLLSSAAFSYYLDHFGHESRSYGAFAGVAVLLLWLFLSGLAVLLGAELNCELERDKAGGS
jgi:membrane protein